MNWKEDNMNGRLLKIKKRLHSFEVTFYKHAEICRFCYALNIWSMGEVMPDCCHRCQAKLSESSD